MLASSANNPKSYKYDCKVAFIFPSSRCNSKLSTKLSLLFFFSPSFKLWRVGHLSLLSIQGPKLIMIFRDYHRQERECKLIFKTLIIFTYTDNSSLRIVLAIFLNIHCLRFLICKNFLSGPGVADTCCHGQ